jgi:hypothetical protein
MRASFSLALGSAVVVLATAATLAHYGVQFVDALPQYGATTTVANNAYGTTTAANTGNAYGTTTVANTGNAYGNAGVAATNNNAYGTTTVANTNNAYGNAGVAATNNVAANPCCAGLFTQGKKVIFTKTGTQDDTLGYAQTTTCSAFNQFPAGFATTFFIDQATQPPQDQWTVDVAGCSGKQFRIQSDQGQYLAVCDTKKFSGNPLTGHYPQLNPTSNDGPDGLRKSLWEFEVILDTAPTCRVAIKNMYSGMTFTVCSQAQCGLSTGTLAGKCPAVVAGTDNSFTFDVTAV